MKIYQSKFLLPFASHFRLQTPQHEKYDREIGKNRLDDIKEQLSDLNVVDLMPGESWNSRSGNFHRVYTQRSRERIYRQKSDLFNLKEFNKFHPDILRVYTKDEIEDYILNLNKCPDIIHCEEIQVDLNEILFYIERGEIKLGQIKPVDLSMRVPKNVLFHIISNHISWDEAHIGYWCSMKRQGDYNQNFWRLLQAPYYMKPLNINYASLPN